MKLDYVILRSSIWVAPKKAVTEYGVTTASVFITDKRGRVFALEDGMNSAETILAHGSVRDIDYIRYFNPVDLTDLDAYPEGIYNVPYSERTGKQRTLVINDDPRIREHEANHVPGSMYYGKR